MESINYYLQPRHHKIIDYLREHSPRKFGLDELAKTLKQSMPVMRNEAPLLVKMGYIQRASIGRTFVYYIDDKLNAIPGQVVDPLQPNGFRELLWTVSEADYEPKPSKLGWKLPYTMGWLAQAALTSERGDPERQQHCREELTDLTNAMETYLLVLKRLLSTTELWGPKLTAWLTAGMNEENLEILAQLTSKTLEHHGRLEPRELETTTE